MSVKSAVAKKTVKKTSTKKAPARIQLTNPDKILYPEVGVTKAELYEYYENIHQWIMPYITNRPITLVRCPQGQEDKCFYQKHTNDTTPDDLHSILIKEKTKSENYIYINELNGLLSLAQMAVLEIHPWGSTIEDVDYPDTIIFDLDPAPGVKWKSVVDAAFKVKEQLTQLKLKSFVKSTGGKGLHVVMPVQPEYPWEEIKVFSHTLVNYMVASHPDKYTDVMSKVKRKGKIFIDYLRNQKGATAVAPYSTRALGKATVATPLDWDELTGSIKDTTYTIRTIYDRLDSLKKDPWKDFFKIKQSLKLDKLK